MRMYDLITKKKHGEVLTDEEIQFMIDGYVKGEIPDYQMSALAMAVCCRGMNERETADLTEAMMKSEVPRASAAILSVISFLSPI